MEAPDDLFADALVAMIRDMTDDELHPVAAMVRHVQIGRAIGGGGADAIIAAALHPASGPDGFFGNGHACAAAAPRRRARTGA